MSIYRPMWGGRTFTLVLFGVFAIASILVVARTVAGGEDAPPLLFTAFWLFAVGWNAYWWCFRFAYELRVDDDAMTWIAPLRQGKVPLTQISQLRPMRLVSNVEIVEHRGGRPIMILAAKGLRDFVDDIARRRPEIPVRVGWSTRLAEGLPGWSRWRRP